MNATPPAANEVASSEFRPEPPGLKCTNPCQHLGVTPFVLSVLVKLGRVKLTRPIDGKPYYAIADLEEFAATLAYPVNSLAS